MPKKQLVKVIPKKKKRKKKQEIIIFDRDQFFKDINKVQLNKTPATIIVPDTENAVVENILKDIGLEFEKKTTTMKVGKKALPAFKYKVIPRPDSPEEHSVDECEDFSDEILEDGQIFF